jgi:predicted RNase H-like HicB family nuclease
MGEAQDALHIQIEHFTGQEIPTWVASCEPIGLVTDGDDFEESLANLQEALDVCLEDTDTVAEFNFIPSPRVVLHCAKTA